jgi:hypothetical protein
MICRFQLLPQTQMAAGGEWAANLFGPGYNISINNVNPEDY